MKKRISEAAADAWGVPKDVIMNIPRFTISGDKEIYIENHKGLLGYTDKEIRVLTGMGTVKIYGKNLCVDRIRLEDILISGKFDAVEYEI
ncbi:MAG: sporulation protein YqfC [Firmicutes bacterium]|nr:sporulation protein YqfC [Bacillota bacterium]